MLFCRPQQDRVRELVPHSALGSLKRELCVSRMRNSFTIGLRSETRSLRLSPRRLVHPKVGQLERQRWHCEASFCEGARHWISEFGEKRPSRLRYVGQVSSPPTIKSAVGGPARHSRPAAKPSAMFDCASPLALALPTVLWVSAPIAGALIPVWKFGSREYRRHSHHRMRRLHPCDSDSVRQTIR